MACCLINLKFTYRDNSLHNFVNGTVFVSNMAVFVGSKNSFCVFHNKILFFKTPTYNPFHSEFIDIIGRILA